MRLDNTTISLFLVFAFGILALIAYAVLAWAGKATGPIDEVVVLSAGALAGLAVPRSPLTSRQEAAIDVVAAQADRT